MKLPLILCRVKSSSMVHPYYTLDDADARMVCTKLTFDEAKTIYLAVSYHQRLVESCNNKELLEELEKATEKIETFK